MAEGLVDLIGVYNMLYRVYDIETLFLEKKADCQHFSICSYLYTDECGKW